jgi:hypothetical protein
MGFFRDVLFRVAGDDEREMAPPPVPGGDLVARWTNEQLRRGDDELRVTLEIFRAGVAPDREHEIRLARTRWLEQHHAIASFTCGVAAEDDEAADVPDPDPWGERTVRMVPVTVAVLADVFVFLREGGDEPGTDPLVDVGRFARASFVSAHLEDASGRRVAGRAGEVFEPVTPCRLVVTWRNDDGTDDHDVFGFMSLSVAEEAAGRFRRFAASA